MATLNDLAAAEADRDNSNRLLDECRLERNVLQKICAERSDEIARLLAIQSIEQARIAAQCLFDWADWNLSAVEASDMDPGWSFDAYKAAETLVAALALRPAPAPAPSASQEK